MSRTSDQNTSGGYAWLIVAVASICLIVSNGLSIGGLPPFFKPLREEFVLSGAVAADHAETFIANAANITFLMSGLFSLIGGLLVRRLGLRLLMTVGTVMLGLGVVLHSRATTAESIYIARFLMGSSLGFVGVTPCVILVSNWFREGRGAALGIALTGTSLGGSIVSLMAAPLISHYGWRYALLTLSALVWLVLLPAVVLFVRDSPLGPGLSDSTPADGLTLRQALATPVFWAFASCAALVFYPIFVTLQQFILYAQTPRLGISAETAALGQSGLFAIGVGGKFIAGWLSDRLRAVTVLLAFACLMFLASLVLLDLTSSNALYFLLPFAIGYGGTWVMLQRLAAELFGRRDIGKILGLITLIEVSGAAVGGRITGYLADRAGGDYTFAFYGVTISAGLAFGTSFLIMLLAGKPAGD